MTVELQPNLCFHFILSTFYLFNAISSSFTSRNHQVLTENDCDIRKIFMECSINMFMILFKGEILGNRNMTIWDAVAKWNPIKIQWLVTESELFFLIIIMIQNHNKVNKTNVIMTICLISETSLGIDWFEGRYHRIEIEWKVYVMFLKFSMETLNPNFIHTLSPATGIDESGISYDEQWNLRQLLAPCSRQKKRY